jgi:hypothetical protein
MQNIAIAFASDIAQNYFNKRFVSLSIQLEGLIKKSLLCFLYIIKIIVQNWIVTAVEAHIMESKFQN